MMFANVPGSDSDSAIRSEKNKTTSRGGPRRKRPTPEFSRFRNSACDQSRFVLSEDLGSRPYRSTAFMPSPIDDDLVDADLVQPSDTELQTGTGHGDDEQNGLDFSSTSPAGNGVNVLDDILDDGDFDDEIELEGDAVQGLRRVSGSVSVARSVSDGDEGEGDSKQARDDDADRSVSATSDRPEPSVSERSDSERKGKTFPLACAGQNCADDHDGSSMLSIGA